VTIPLWLQLLASALLVAAVLWYMFRLPPAGDTLVGLAPFMALASVWLGVFAALAAGLLWLVRHADSWVALSFLLLDPAALGAGILVLWIHRGRRADPAQMQRIQAMVGIGLGIASVIVGYVYVLSHKAPFTPVGM